MTEFEKQGLSRKQYVGLHRWLVRKNGSAYKCENPNCKGISQTYNWSLKPGKLYERNINNFMQLCKSCHAIIDGAGYYSNLVPRTKKWSKNISNGLKNSQNLKNAQTQEWKNSISNTLSGFKQPLLVCPHCKKTGGGHAMKRWHFDNCRIKQF